MSLSKLFIMYICAMLTIAACAVREDPMPKWSGYALEFKEIKR